MDSVERTFNEQEIMDAFVGLLSEKMAKADWYYEYSDDPRNWRSGNYVIKQIKEELKLLSRLDGGFDEAKKLWEKYVPEHSVREPSFFSNPELLNSVLGGSIMKSDIPKVLVVLNVLQNNGNRFVVFENDPLIIPNARFIGFFTAIEAHDFAYENSKHGKTIIMSSIADLQKDLQSSPELDIWKGYTLKEIIDKLPGMDKSNRGPDLSR